MKRGSWIGGTSPDLTAAPVSRGVVAVGDTDGAVDPEAAAVLTPVLDGTGLTAGLAPPVHPASSRQVARLRARQNTAHDAMCIKPGGMIAYRPSTTVDERPTATAPRSPG